MLLERLDGRETKVCGRDWLRSRVLESTRAGALFRLSELVNCRVGTVARVDGRAEPLLGRALVCGLTLVALLRLEELLRTEALGTGTPSLERLPLDRLVGVLLVWDRLDELACDRLDERSLRSVRAALRRPLTAAAEDRERVVSARLSARARPDRAASDL